MALVLETGSGIRGADSYASIAFVTTYLTGLNRVTAWAALTVAEQEAAILEATSYIDTRWRKRFKGVKLRIFTGANAQAILAYTILPVAADTVTVGTTQYTYVSTLTTLGSDEILIGIDLDTTVATTIEAINASAGLGERISNTALANDSASAALIDGSTTDILLTANQIGLSGNDIPLTITSTGNSVDTAFVNGLDQGNQTLEFPRNGLFDPDGQRVDGIPLKLKQAMAEYADRARAALLYTDPTVDATGKVVTEKFEKVGPIEERTKYSDGGSLDQLLTPYPAADRLLSDYLFPAGRVHRG